MAVFNGQRFLCHAIRSIQKQTFTDFEFIIVDDGSTDRTPSILADAASSDPRIQVVSRTNCGLTKSLNIAIELSSGEYIARMDADDIATKDRFLMQTDHLDRNPDLVLIGGQIIFIDPEGVKIGRRHSPPHHRDIEQQLLAGISSAITHPAIMMRRKTMLGVGGYDERFEVGQDLQLFLKAARLGGLANIPAEVLYYRQHSESVNHKEFRQWRDAKHSAIKEACLDRSIAFNPESIVIGDDPETYTSVHKHRAWSVSAIQSRHLIGAWKHGILYLLKSGQLKSVTNMARVFYRTFFRKRISTD